MAPTKLEKHIKEKLEHREIMPSANAWEQISGELETPKKKSKRVVWYAIAASFIGLVIASVLFFNAENDNVKANTEIVVSPQREIDSIVKKGDDSMELPVGVVVVGVEENKDASIAKKQNVESNASLNKKEIFLEEKNLVNESSQVTEVSIEPIENLMEEKINEVIEQVQFLENNNDAITNAEVDSLLRKAQRELLADKIFMENHKVDAMALLIEVENELDQSFRDQIFEKLKSKFIKVRTAVADRNN